MNDTRAHRGGEERDHRRAAEDAEKDRESGVPSVPPVQAKPEGERVWAGSQREGGTGA